MIRKSDMASVDLPFKISVRNEGQNRIKRHTRACSANLWNAVNDAESVTKLHCNVLHRFSQMD